MEHDYDEGIVALKPCKSSPASSAQAPPPKKPSLSLNPLDFFYMFSGKRKRAPSSKEVATEIGRLEKMTGKMAIQQKRVNDILRDWGAELPEPESRELTSNMHNLLSGPLVVYNELQSRLATIHSNFVDLIRMEDHNARMETELKATQKLYYKANYRDFPPYQIDSYQASYESICAEIDELHLRHRNRLVFMMKQSYQLLLQQMLDCHQTQKVCAETGIRFLAGFDAEPRDVLPEGYPAYSAQYSADTQDPLGNATDDMSAGLRSGTRRLRSLMRGNANGRSASSGSHGGVTGMGVGNEDPAVVTLSALALSPAPQIHIRSQVDENEGDTEANHAGLHQDMYPRRKMTTRSNQALGHDSHVLNHCGIQDISQENEQEEDEEDEEAIKPITMPVLQSYPGPYSGFRC